ncbi:glycosyltransferase family 2 protein [Pseudozobellia thermophila]|uniref:Glycosyltransferase, GT2 family n=1 Tax=Pseudozobellia thermophila TaxID=192903 RepID=A0A1M6KR42_9FLAO|nr:glycosyltransferase family 2 protein [Pseudozobellia thermophila]SHJ61376.1 Glycosyltransferase, GT2 family [Pseudozobellia thermophila]
MKSIAVLLTVFNRKEKTLKALQKLFANEIPPKYGVEVFMVDDGCTDGTPEAVADRFPQVHIVEGNGQLFWNRGMHLAWETAAQTKDYDFYLWLNDDTFLYTDALAHVLECSEEMGHKALVSGFLCSERDANKTTYGSWVNDKMIDPIGTIQKVDIINGNVVLVPKVIYKEVGQLDPVFPHAIGDFDYGLRVQKKGYTCYTTKKYVGTCENNPKLPKWCYASTPFKERLKALYSPLGYAHPKYFFIYEKRNFGWPRAVKHFVTIHLRVLFPQLWT